MDLKLQSLQRRRDKAETRMTTAKGLNQNYYTPSIHRYERDIAQDMIKEELQGETRQ